MLCIIDTIKLEGENRYAHEQPALSQEREFKRKAIFTGTHTGIGIRYDLRMSTVIVTTPWHSGYCVYLPRRRSWLRYTDRKSVV